MKALFIAVFTALALTASAQLSASKLILLTGGFSHPVGTFGGNQFDLYNAGNYTQKSGFAKNGFNGAISFQHTLPKLFNLGYFVTIRYQSFSFNTDAFSTAFNGTTDANNWSSMSVLAGPMWTFALSEKFKLEPHFQAGMAMAQSPHVSSYSEGSFIQPPQSANAFTYAAGVNCRYDGWPRISLIVNIDYQSTTPTFNMPQYSGYSWKPTISSLSANLGVGYRF